MLNRLINAVVAAVVHNKRMSIAGLVGLLTVLAAKFGLDLSPETLTWLAVVIIGALGAAGGDTHRRVIPVLLACLLLPAALVQVACGEADVQKFADTSLTIQQGVERGIPVARALRESGAVTPEFNLDLARKAKKFNSLHLATIKVALSGDANGGNLYDQLQALISAGDDLKRDGTIKVGGRTQVIFDLGVELAQSELADFADTLKGKGGVKIPVSPAAREKLNRAEAAAGRNAEALDRAVAQLEALTGPAN